jgi:NAD(P)-dependent dehydrogenase (short-subunit alcohol dehydrogenase family)
MKKVALITGGAGNLGAAVVSKYLKEGFVVVATVTPGKKQSSNVSDLHYEEVDLRDEVSTNDLIQKTIEQFKRIDVIVCTVGGFDAGDIKSTDGKSLERMYQLNFKTAYNTARPAYEQMKKQSEGKIIFIGSRAALEPARGKSVLSYALSKSLLVNLAELLNAESKKIRSHIVAPATIDTPENRAAMPDVNFKEWITAEKLAELIFGVTDGDTADVIVKAY